MKKDYYYIPTYEEIKELDKKYEYSYHLFDIAGSGYLRIYYNEDGNGKISVDYIEGGFLRALHLPIYTKTTICENKFYDLNKTNYNKIIKFVKLVKEAILKNLKGFEKNE